MKFTGLLAIAAAGLLLTAATPLGLDGEQFVGAVRDGNNDKALELLNGGGPTIVNAKDADGNTALIFAAGKRDDAWTGFLLSKGADVNLANRNGDTALIAAARVGYGNGVLWLLQRRAKVDHANRRGETALIIAVQQRYVPLVKLLLAKGANPDKADNVAGYSARDYAKRDNRVRELLRLIEAAKTPAPTASD